MNVYPHNNAGFMENRNNYDGIFFQVDIRTALDLMYDICVYTCIYVCVYVHMYVYMCVYTIYL